MKTDPVKTTFTIFIFLVLILNSNPCMAVEETMYKINDQYTLKIPGLKPEMLGSDYWIKTLEKPDELILNDHEITSFNRKNFSHCEKLADLENFKLAFSRKEVRDLISKVSKRPSKKLFSNGKPLDPGFFDQLESELNLENIPRVIEVRFAVTVRRTEMRSFPTSTRIFDEEEDYEFDRMIETTLYPIEPIAVLHASRDGKWYFAQCYNYLAWIAAEDVAVATKNDLFSMLNRKNFLVVTGKKVVTGYNPIHSSVSELQLDMGVRIPLALEQEIPDHLDGQHPMGNYVVQLPTRNPDGRLEWRQGFISLSDDVSLGYLPYTRKVILRQAFKFLGQRYGWGGMFNARDCTSFILDIYRTVGLLLPRNSGEQGKLSWGKLHALTDEMSLDDRVRVFSEVPPVTPVYMNGHAMLYLSKRGQDFFIIHDFSALRTKEQGVLKETRARTVFVTPLLNTFLSSGKTYLEGLYGAREFR